MELFERIDMAIYCAQELSAPQCAEKVRRTIEDAWQERFGLDAIINDKDEEKPYSTLRGINWGLIASDLPRQTRKPLPA